MMQRRMNPYGFILLLYAGRICRKKLLAPLIVYFFKIVGTFRMMFFRKLILLICFCVLISLSNAQQVNFIKYTVHDGLVANPVRCIYQDSKGFIWIGTFEGLSRYDGYKFTNYSTLNGLSHNLINSVFEVDNKLLIAENNGRVDVIQDNNVRRGFTLASAANYILPYKNRFLISTDASGFYEYKNDTVIKSPQQITRTPLGDFTEYNDSLMICDGVDNLFAFTKDLKLYASIRDLSLFFFSVFRDSKKRGWVCTSNGLKLLHIPVQKGQPLSFDPLPSPFNFSPLNNSQVTSMIETNDGSFWIGTSKGLVHLYANGDYQVYEEKDGLPSAYIQTIHVDREDNLWIGTTLGLAKWVSKNNVAFYNSDHKNFKADVISLYVLPNKKVILHTVHGLQQFYFETKDFKDVRTGTDYSYLPIAGTYPLLVHSAKKIGVLNEITNSVRNISTLDSDIFESFRAYRHPSGTIMVGSQKGLYAFRNSAVKKLLPDRITSIMIDHAGYIWAGSWTAGLYRIKENSAVVNGSYEIEDLTSVVKHKEIRSLYEDSENNIWVGTRYGGAFRLIPKDSGRYETQNFNRQSGLMSDWVKSLAETENGDIWVGTYLGLDRLVKEAKSYRVFNFSKATNFFAQVEKIASLGNNNWICAANTGLAYFKDEEIHKTLPLQSSILSVSLGVLENKLTITSPYKKVFLNPNQNSARFEFSALGFINERQIMYSYRLKGSGDTTWSKPENIHEASYASLSPGEYTFEVKTIGWNGQDGMPAAFSFFIATPFWRQGWFIGLLVLVIASFFYALYRYRIRQLLRLQNVRNSIATDLHDDIGSSLTNISILSELSSKNLSQPEKAQPFLQRISEEVQASSQAMDDIIWSVNSRNDSLQETMARMRRYAAELFDNSNIKCHLHLDENTGNKKLSMEQRRDVYLIYKEALNNIHKHAHAKNVWIDVTQNQNYLLMQLKDDGRGFSTDLITHRNGLNNLRSRVEKWRGKIKILSAENKGTAIEIKIPLKE